MRTLDWSSTKLGPIDRWPQSLRTSVSTCLNSRFALLVWWGPDLVMLYNDAYREIIASKHPAALGNPGRDCWPEIWETIGPMLEGVMQRGEATWSDDLLLLLARHGYPEECYFTFSYSPISDESGGIGGVFTPVIETTDRVIAERRSNTLRELAGSSIEAKSENGMWTLAAQMLGRNRHDISFSVLYALSPDGKHIHPKSWNAIPPNDALCHGPKVLGELDSPLLRGVREALHTGEMVLEGDLQQHCPDLPLGVWGIAPVQAVALPVAFPGQSSPAACLLLGLNARKRFDRDYLLFLETLARQLASNLAAARAHEEETKRAEMLAELDRAKTVFFSNVSHEFRTPLTLMVGPVESMLERACPSAIVSKEELQLVHRNSMRLLKLVNTLLDFSRIEAGRVEAIYEPTDLSAFTADTASAFRSAMEQAALKFVIDCEPLSNPAYVDRDMWEKIVLNLISNAFKFTLSGGVTVRLRAIGDQIELRVEDTGLGIPQEEQSKVFERFHRIEGVLGRTHEGTGIGLALVQELVKLHRGSIRVESAVGKGSTFIVSIPKEGAKSPADGRESKQRMLKSTGVSASAYVDEALRWLPETQQTKRPEVFASDSVQAPHVQTTTGRILLADDNADMRQYVRRLLGDNYEVNAVSNGVEALASIQSNPPDLVLTDVMMPELDGFGLLRELRSDESTKTIPIILLSARAGEDARIEGMQAGADDYVVKPFTARELLARVGAHLAMGRLRREAAEHERSLRADSEAAHERTSTILESISDSFFALDRNWKFTYVNAAAEQTLNMRRAELVGRDFWDVLPLAKGTLLETQYRQAMSERVSVQFENYYVPWERWYHVRAYPAADGGISVFYQDITERKHAENALRQQNERSEFVAEASDAGFWFCDLPFDKLIWDKRVKKHFWLQPDADITIQTFYEQIHPDDREPTRQAIEKSIVGKERYDTEYRTVAPDGRYKWIRAIGRCFYDKAGNPTSFDGITLDITERKLAEDAVRRSEEQFKVLANSLPELCWMAHSDGHIFWYNPRWYEYTGTTPAQMEGWGWQSVHDPEMLPSVLERWRASLQNEQPFEMEFPLRGADGVFRWFLTRVSPVRNANGKITRWIGTDTNIHAERELRQSLIEARDELETRVQQRTAELQKKTTELTQKATLLDLANDAIFVRNAEDKIAYWNQGAERLYGWTSGEVLGRSSHEVLRTEFPVPVEEIKSMDNWEGELRHNKRDGSQIVVTSRWTTLRDNEGKPAGWLEINSDITARKRAEEAARKLSGRILSLQDEERRRIARGLHDSLGQYLTAIKMSLDLLSTTEGRQAAVASECSEIVDKCLAETRTISHLLHPPLLDEAGLMSALQWYVDGFAQRSAIRVTLDLPAELGRLNSDIETALFRVVQEALTNVHRHSSASEVDISLLVDTKHIQLDVSDNGKGIPKDRLQGVLESGSGTGVGLAGMRERVRDLGGSMKIKSDDAGTTIIISIPLIELAPADSQENGESVRSISAA